MALKSLYKTFTVLLVGTVATTMLPYSVTAGGEVDISNQPMENAVKGAPPIIMYLIDNGATMDMEVTTNKKKGGPYYWRDEGDHTIYNLFAHADNYFCTERCDHTDGHLEGSGWHRRHWKSQWHGFNKQYYDPNITYEPWPMWNELNGTEDANGVTKKDGGNPESLPFNADMANPRWNPLKNSSTIALFDVFEDDLLELNGTFMQGLPPDPYYWEVGSRYWKDKTARYPNFGFDSYASGAVIPYGDADGDGDGGGYYARKTDTTSGNYCVYQPDIPVAGNYTIYGQWPCGEYFNSETEVKLDIEGDGTTDYTNTVNQDATVANQVEAGRCGELVPLFDRSFTLEQGRNAKLTFRMTDSSKGAVPSDMVYFLLKGHTPPPLTYDPPLEADGTCNSCTVSFDSWLSINNAHYYMVDDKDGDGEEVSGEIYLVNFEWDDDGNVIPEIGEVKRRYYLMHNKTGSLWINSSWTDYDDYDEAWAIVKELDYQPDNPANDEVPDSIQPIMYDENGNTLGLEADYNDLQNLANWVSFHRKRIQVAKSIVGTSLMNMDLNTVKVGYYALVDGDGYIGRMPASDSYTIEELLDPLYNLETEGFYSWLKEGFYNLGQYLDKDDGDDGGMGAACPYDSACQQAYGVILSDGFFADHEGGLDWQPMSDNADGDHGAPYEDSYSATLADYAMYFYDKDLASTLADEVPTTIYDKRETQHLVTITVGVGPDPTIPLDDMDEDGVTDEILYRDDPNFLRNKDTYPNWPNAFWGERAEWWHRERITDLWHAAINGRGRFFQAYDTYGLNKIFGSRQTSGASVAVNGQKLSTGLRIFESSYDSENWTGNIEARVVTTSGEISDESTWSAQTAMTELDYSSRVILSYNGTKGVPFQYNDLNAAQFSALGNSIDMVDYLRGKEIAGYRVRQSMLGDFVHSAPQFVDSPFNNNATIVVGGNDGMLHGFDAKTGKERFAYVPLHSSAYLTDLAEVDYEDNHRYYVDGTPFVMNVTRHSSDRGSDGFDNDMDGSVDEEDGSEDYSDSIDNDRDGYSDEQGEVETITMVAGGLNYGGRGIYALNLTSITDDYYTEEELADGDDAASPKIAELVMWEYPPIPTGGLKYIDADSDGIDNDQDGVTDEPGEKDFNFDDDDMGYSYSRPVIANSYIPSDDGGKWIVVFGNGYNSKNGHAVLYVVDALTGKLIRKIDTGAGDAADKNGLSSPTLIDVDNDYIIDFAYAGDLQGNLWKFDLTDTDPDKWGASFGTDTDENGRIDAGEKAAPLISIPDQPITSAPDVSRHCAAPGYMVFFGTGKYLGDSDLTNTDQQSIFGIWDYDEKDKAVKPGDYLGTFSRAANATLMNGTTLLEQTEIYSNYHIEDSWNSWVRVISDNTPRWVMECNDGVDNDNDGKIDYDDVDITGSNDPELCIPTANNTYTYDDQDNDGDGEVDEADEAIGHAGWYFDLPYNTADVGAERIVNDVIVRGGRLVYISFMPGEGTSECTGAGYSILSEVDFCNGGRTDAFDMNDDGSIDDNDYVTVDGQKYAVQGKRYTAKLYNPAIVDDPDDETELKIIKGSSGSTNVVREYDENLGKCYWREY